MRYKEKIFRVSSVHWPKREFDPDSREDLVEYKHFLEHHTWRDGCPFLVEWPYLDIIKCIEDKIVKHYIDHLIQQTQ
jgi:hypothetical protein